MTQDLHADVLRYLGRQQEPLRANLVSATDLVRALRASEQEVDRAVQTLRNNSLVDVVRIDRSTLYVFITRAGREWLRGRSLPTGA